MDTMENMARFIPMGSAGETGDCYLPIADKPGMSPSLSFTPVLASMRSTKLKKKKEPLTETPTRAMKENNEGAVRRSSRKK